MKKTWTSPDSPGWRGNPKPDHETIMMYARTSKGPHPRPMKSQIKKRWKIFHQRDKDPLCQWDKLQLELAHKTMEEDMGLMGIPQWRKTFDQFKK